MLKQSTSAPKATFITCSGDPFGKSVATVAVLNNCLYSLGECARRIAENACNAVGISTAPPSA
eukprot:3103512-Amphidinium_carterae.1